MEPGLCPLSISSEHNKAGPRAVCPCSLNEFRCLMIGSLVNFIGELTISDIFVPQNAINYAFEFSLSPANISGSYNPSPITSTSLLNETNPTFI